MRCPDCQKFVPFNTEEEPEEESAEVTGSAEEGYTFAGSWRRMLSCENCGTELKEHTFELEHEITKEELPDEPCKNADGHDFDVSCWASPTQDTVTKDRNGKPIKNARYMKTLYGVEIEVELKCRHCDAEVSFNLADSEQASGFDELT